MSENLPTLASIARALGGKVSNNQVIAAGPGHSQKDESLSVKLDDAAPDGFVVNSFSGDDPIACKDYVRKALDIPAWKPKHPKERWPEYFYRTDDGNPYLKVTRTPDKNFWQSRWNGQDWEKGKPKGPKIPYRLPELLTAPLDAAVYIVEGEKDADRLAALGFVATTASEGAGKWRPELNSYFKGRTVFILADNDAPGEAHALMVAKGVAPVAAEVRICRLPGLPLKGDVSDWLNAGNDAATLLNLCRAMPVWGADASRDAAETKERPKARSIAAVGDNQAIVTEDEAALRFAERYSGRLRYCHDHGSWFEWNSSIWKKNSTGLAFHFARELARGIAQDEDDKVKVTASKAAFAGAVERFARSDPKLAVTSEVWDQDSFLLGTPSGTIDLRTGILRKADFRDGITKSVTVTPADKAACPLWLRFLDEATGGDAEMIRFMRQWCGYALTGDTREHALVFVFGDGGNGKSVFVNVITGIMADYATIASMETFVASNGDKHPTDLAMLRGARLVTASETEEGRQWAESRIKQLTGGDAISARFMRQDFFTFKPAFKLTIIGNHKPGLRNIDDAARRRFNLVPFTRKPASPDRMLEQKLKSEWPAILRWMIDGCIDWQENGLVRPNSIVDATAAYFSEQDTIGAWLEDECDVEPGNTWKSALSADLFRSWSAYAIAAGEQPGNRKHFADAMQKRGFQIHKGTGGIRLFRGVRLKPKTPPDADDRR